VNLLCKLFLDSCMDDPNGRNDLCAAPTAGPRPSDTTFYFTLGNAT
jgi:hypothetical protein